MKIQTITSITAVAVQSLWVPNALAFAPQQVRGVIPKIENKPLATTTFVTTSSSVPKSNPLTTDFKSSTALNSLENSNESNTGFFSNVKENPIPLVLWATLVTFAFGFAPGGIGSPESTAFIDQVMADPVTPSNSAIFNYVFALFVYVPLTNAAVIMPGTLPSEGQKLPATPFLFGSGLIGYFILGPYMTLRKSVESVKKSDLGWFTSNVLENRIFHWVLLALAASSFYTTGFLPGLLADFNGEVTKFTELVTTTSFASVSTMDLTILSLNVALLIPEDLKRRGFEEGDEGKAKAIAASTMLFPVIGSILYCALRPELED